MLIFYSSEYFKSDARQQSHIKWIDEAYALFPNLPSREFWNFRANLKRL
ncbi:MAG: hypothetical protein M1536_01205 [Firmicutes bacterium]|nr:hypothetical protein [Bacillota bacterium]